MPSNQRNQSVQQQQHQQAGPTSTSMRSAARRSPTCGARKRVTLIACSLCLLGSLVLVAKPAEAGRLQDFIQNLVGGGNSNSNSNNNNNNNNNANSNSNSNSNDNDADASGADANEQPLTPMMSAMNPFIRYPSFYDSFGPAGYAGFPGLSFANPMSAMSGLSPMAAMSSNPLGGAFSPAAFSPASFGSYASSSGNPLSSAFTGTNGMSASTLSNVYTTTPNLLGGYTPYYGRRR